MKCILKYECKMSGLNMRAFSRNFKRRRFTSKRREIPQGIFKFSVSSDAATKGSLVSNDIIEEPELDNDHNTREDRPMNVDLSQTKCQMHGEIPSKVSNSAKRKVGRMNDPSDVFKPTTTSLKESLLPEAVSKDISAMHDVETPHSIVRNGVIHVRKLEDKCSEVARKVIDYSTNEKVEIKDCYVGLSKFVPDLPFGGETRTTVVNISTSKQSAESHTVGNMKHSNISYSATIASNYNKEQMLEVNQKKSSNEDEPKVIKLKTLKYRSTFPKKKPLSLSLEFVSTPCDDSEWNISARSKQRLERKKENQEKHRLAVKDEPDEVLLWSGRTSCRKITDLTDLEIAYTVIKNVLNEYSTSDKSTSKFVEKYGKCIEDQVVKKMINVESLKSVSKEIRKLSIETLNVEPVKTVRKKKQYQSSKEEDDEES